MLGRCRTEVLMSDRAHDIVLWGATGFTGQRIAAYFARNAPAGLRWGLGGRDRGKLEEVRRGLPGEASRVPIVTHDATSEGSMRELAGSTRVVCTTVGPYGRYGLPLARACAELGTDYCDITGEVPFMRRVIDECHERARATQSRIVHTCGFDSIPSDLGVYLVARHAGRPLSEVRFILTDSRGNISGGTAATMLDLIDQARRDPAMRRLLAQAHALDPDPKATPRGPRQRRGPVTWDADLRSFVAPFPMAAVNVRVVHRSNALAGFAYGEGLGYRETMIIKGPLYGLPGAIAATAGMAAFGLAASLGPTRAWVERRLPKPGQGPSEARIARGYFKVTLLGTARGDERPSVAAYIEGGEPGYGETATMLAESALSLAVDPRNPGFEGGVLTPATALGEHLVARLRARGMRLDVGAWPC
jgi:short subunit dehydrogenase-like uncharacterized protein